MSPVVPSWLLLILVIVAFLFVRLSYRQQTGNSDRIHRLLTFFRLSIFLLIVFLAANIQWVRTGSLNKKPLIKIFFDNSVSAGYHQSVSKQSLLNGYEEILNVVDELAYNEPTDFSIEAFTFGETVSPLSGSPLGMGINESSTDLSAVLTSSSELAGDEELNGVIIVSDGQTTVGADPVSSAGDVKVPIYTIGIGEPLRMVDIRINSVEVPTVSIRGEMVSAKVTIESFGKIDQRVHVSLEKGGALLGTQIIAPSGEGSSQIVRFQFEADQIGNEEYVVQASSVKDEINIDNNRYPFSLSVLKDRFRVALITGAPSFNTRFLKLVLESEPKLSVEHFVQQLSGWVPTIASFWRQSYDLIILDNFPTSTTPNRWSEDLARKLDQGKTAVALIAGEALSEDKLLAYLSILGLQPLGGKTRTGGQFPVEAISESSDPMKFFELDWSQFPPLSPKILVEPGEERMVTTAQLSALSPIPLIIAGKMPDFHQKIQTVRRYVFTSADLWHLYFRGKGTEVNAAVKEYWVNLWRWLVAMSGEEDRYFRMTKSTFQRGEEASIEGAFSSMNTKQLQGGIWWRISRTDMEETLVPLTKENESDMWKGFFIAAEPGRYKYWTLIADEQFSEEEPHGVFFVEQALLELKNVYLDKESLESISELTGGNYLPWSERLNLVDHLTIKPRKEVFSQTVDLSHWSPFLILLLVFLAAEWALRRAKGLQ